MCTGYTQVEIYVEVYGVYAGEGIHRYTYDRGVRGIRRGKYTWRYTGYTPVTVYVVYA